MKVVSLLNSNNLNYMEEFKLQTREETGNYWKGMADRWLNFCLLMFYLLHLCCQAVLDSSYKCRLNNEVGRVRSCSLNLIECEESSQASTNRGF